MRAKPVNADDRNVSPARRTGDQTKEQILSVSLDLFITKGYEGTSVRDIADAVGMSPAALYYHFGSKEEIATGFLQQRRSELDELVAWIQEQPPSDDLVTKAALRWLDHATAEQLQAMRFAFANLPFLRQLGGRTESLIVGFDRVVDVLTDAGGSEQHRMRVYVIFDTLSAAIRAGDRVGANDEGILAAARSATIALGADVNSL